VRGEQERLLFPLNADAKDKPPGLGVKARKPEVQSRKQEFPRCKQQKSRVSSRPGTTETVRQRQQQCPGSPLVRGYSPSTKEREGQPLLRPTARWTEGYAARTLLLTRHSARRAQKAGRRWPSHHAHSQCERVTEAGVLPFARGARLAPKLSVGLGGSLGHRFAQDTPTWSLDDLRDGSRRCPVTVGRGHEEPATPRG
jgi:hypothetical protein